MSLLDLLVVMSVGLIAICFGTWVDLLVENKFLSRKMERELKEFIVSMEKRNALIEKEYAAQNDTPGWDSTQWDSAIRQGGFLYVDPEEAISKNKELIRRIVGPANTPKMPKKSNE